MQRAVLFGLLLMLQFAVAFLMPIELAESSDPFWEAVTSLMAGSSLAVPPLLAVWTVFGPQRFAARVPLTLCLAVGISLALFYGLKRNFGDDTLIVIPITLACFLTFGVLQMPLWLLRAARRWRVERIAFDYAAAVAHPAVKSARQFLLRDLFGWMLAAASVLAAFRVLAPGGNPEIEAPLELVAEFVPPCLLLSFGGLPTIALVWIVLADGRRPALRIVLSLLFPLVFVGACLGGFLDVKDAVLMGVGGVLNGLISLFVARACGYRLYRRPKGELATQHGTVSSPASRLHFVAALAPLVLAAAALVMSLPHQFEQWRRADVHRVWNRSGLDVSFDNEGKIVKGYYQLGEPISDELCQRLAEIETLRDLDLTGSAIGDQQLRLLEPLVRLERLNLSSAAVTDSGLEQLGSFRQLVSLNLTHTPITDSGLKHLKGLTKLEELTICLTEITDQGFAALEELPSLRTVRAELTAVSADGTKAFRRRHPRTEIEIGACDALLHSLPFTSQHGSENGGWGWSSYEIQETIMLKRLHARGAAVREGVATPVTDKGVFALAKQTELEELDLRESAVTDLGLWSLRLLKQLKRLDVRGTRVTQKGVARLAAALPACEIVQ